MDCLLTASTVLAALGSGLIAGVFFAFAAFVLAALSRLPAPAGITAMQTMIAAIKSPLFLVVFFGSAALAALMGIAATLKWSEPGALYLLIGSLLYLNGPFGVTLLKTYRSTIISLPSRLAVSRARSSGKSSAPPGGYGITCAGSPRSALPRLSFGPWSKAAHFYRFASSPTPTPAASPPRRARSSPARASTRTPRRSPCRGPARRH